MGFSYFLILCTVYICISYIFFIGGRTIHTSASFQRYSLDIENPIFFPLVRWRTIFLNLFSQTKLTKHILRIGWLFLYLRKESMYRPGRGFPITWFSRLCLPFDAQFVRDRFCKPDCILQRRRLWGGAGTILQIGDQKACLSVILFGCNPHNSNNPKVAEKWAKLRRNSEKIAGKEVKNPSNSPKTAKKYLSYILSRITIG